MQDNEAVYENEFREIQKAAEKKHKINESELLEDLKFVMSDPRGRRFIWRMLDITRLFGDTFTGNSFTYYNLGRQEIGKWLFCKAKQASLKLWRRAEDENIEREKLKHGR